MKSEIKRRNDVPTSFDSKALLLVIIGTAYQALVEWLSKHPKAVVFVADVAAELEQIKLRPDHTDRVFLLPIGGSKTAQQLVKEFGTPEQASILAKLPNCSSVDGQGQWPGIGKAGTGQLISKPSTQRLFDQLLARLTELSGGNIPELDVTAYTSISGGTGSLGSGELVDELVSHLHSQTRIPIDVKVHAVGGITFFGSSFPRTQLNSGSALTHWIKRCLHPVDNRVTFNFFCHEVYPAQDNRLLRNQLILDQEAAMRAPEVARRLTQDRSNRALNGPQGNIALISTDHFGNIPRKQILRDMADAYLWDIEDLLQTAPALSHLLDIKFDYEMSESRLVSSYDLALKAIDLPHGDSVLELLECEGHILAIEPRAVLLSGARIPLRTIAEQYSRLPSSPESCSQALGLLAAIEDYCIDYLDSLDVELADLEVSVDEAAELVLKKWKKIDKPSFLPPKNENDRFADLVEAIDRYQTCLRAASEAEGEIEALQVASAYIGDVATVLLDRLHKLTDALRSRADFHSGISEDPFTVAKPLEQVFEALMTASGSSRAGDSPIDHCLCNSIAAVTRAGLRSITNAVDTGVDAIVDAVHCRNGAIRGPGWAGEDNSSDLEYAVYPPVTAEDRQLLEDAHAGQHSGMKVAFSKPDAPSHNVVILRVSYCRELDDVLRPFYRTGLRKALESPMSSLFLPDEELPGSLGIKFE